MHIYSPKHRVLFSAKVVQQYIWRSKLLFSTWFLVTLGCSQGAHVFSPSSPSKSLQRWRERWGGAMEKGLIPEGGHNSLRKQLSISWWPQGHLNFFYFSLWRLRGRGEKHPLLAVVLEDAVSYCAFGTSLRSSLQKEPHPANSQTRGSLHGELWCGSQWGTRYKEVSCPSSISEVWLWVTGRRDWTVDGG
jgi:hypothetical protein